MVHSLFSPLQSDIPFRYQLCAKVKVLFNCTLFNLSQAGLCSPKSCSPLRVASTTLPTQPLEKNPEKLSLVLEPESATVFCQTMSKKHLAPQCQATEPFTASRYLIVNVGGETVDISAHCIAGEADKYITVIHPTIGNDYGGTRVNREFREFLESLVQDKSFKRFLDTYDSHRNDQNQAYFNELLNETFESQKEIFGSKRFHVDGMLSVYLPYMFLETYRSKLQEGLSTMGGSEARLVGSNLRISYNLMAKFFKPVRDGIIRCIEQTLDSVEDIEKIYLVGYFGGSEYLFREIEAEFKSKNCQCVVPDEPAYAAVKGAVLTRLLPNTIKYRKVDATYGIATSIGFIPYLHDPEYRWINDDGEPCCESRFSTVVERGDLVGVDEVFTKILVPAYHDQKSMKLEFYCSPEKDVWYVTGKRRKHGRTTEPVKVQKVGMIEIEMPDLRGDKKRVVEVTFEFRHTEIQVQAFDRTSKNEVKIFLDFLTS